MRWGLWTSENGVDRTVDELKTANIYIVCCQDVLQSVKKTDFSYKMPHTYLKSQTLN